MEEFFGRENELAVLKSLYQEKGIDGAIVYGRRRFGKTTLIKKSAESFSGTFLYYQCLKALDLTNAQGLASLIRSSLSDVSISSQASFMEVLDYLFSRSVQQPLVLVLDEYPFLANRSTIDSYLQSLMERYKNRSSLKIILSGSYVSVMEHLLDDNNPLHGRFRYKIKIEAFDYYDAARFYPEASDEDKIRFYSVFGGTPYYLTMIDPALSFENNLKKLLLDPYAPLENEINSTMKEEYSKIENAAFVMDLIMRGKHSFSDIHSIFSSAAPNSDLPYLLEQLVSMKFIDKNYPINDGNHRKAFYTISDNLFAFYFQLIYPNLAHKNVLSVDDFYARYVAEALENSFIPHRFERICGEYLIRVNRRGGWSTPLLSIGSYVFNDPQKKKNGQFDLVSEDDRGRIFYECKFTKEKVGPGVFQEEKDQLDNLSLDYYKLGFFSRSGFEKGEWAKDCLCFSLSDLYF
jgi:AAA+ ATPase superfamily predicted ATPase